METRSAIEPPSSSKNAAPAMAAMRRIISEKNFSGSMLIMRLVAASNSQSSFQNSIWWKNVQKLEKSSAAHVPMKPANSAMTNAP